MRLEHYLARIGFTGSPRPDLPTLCGLHRAHLRAIPYENLDIHLGGRLTLDLAQIFAKIVDGGRGGWCYEMNGLFAWALREIGFGVRLLSSGVDRPPYANAVDGDHLVLLVELDRPYLADVGFGNGFIEPLPLEPGGYRQGELRFELNTDGERWYFTNHRHGGPGYVFRLTPRQLEDFAAACDRQQTDPGSGFVRTTVCHRFGDAGVASLRGAVLSELRGAELARRTIADAEEYAGTLQQVFGLRIAEAETLWAQVWARHQIWLAEQGEQQ